MTKPGWYCRCYVGGLSGLYVWSMMSVWGQGEVRCFFCRSICPIQNPMACEMALHEETVYVEPMSLLCSVGANQNFKRRNACLPSRIKINWCSLMKTNRISQQPFSFSLQSCTFLWRPREFFRISRFLETVDPLKPFVSFLWVAGGKWRENPFKLLG